MCYNDRDAFAALEPERVRRYVEKWFETFSPRKDSFADSASSDKRARGGLATVFAGLSDEAERNRLVDAIASFALSELHLRNALVGRNAMTKAFPFWNEKGNLDLLYPLRLVWRRIRRRR